MKAIKDAKDKCDLSEVEDNKYTTLSSKYIGK